MDKESLQQFYDNRTRITINLKPLPSGIHYTGLIEKLTDRAITFTDKYQNTIIIDLDQIATATPKKNEEKQ